MTNRSNKPREDRRRGRVATSALALLLFASAACSGNATRLSLLADLRLAVLEVPPLLEAGEHFTFVMTLENTGSSPVDVCITDEIIGLRSPNGHSYPIKLSFSFDRGCAQRITLQPHSVQRFEHDGFVFPTVQPGPSTLFARFRLLIELGQLYWPSNSYSLVAADRTVSVNSSEIGSTQ